MAATGLPFMRLPCRAPLLGSYFRSSTVRGIRKAALEGDPDAVCTLSYALIESKYRDVRTSAAAALSFLSSSEAIDVFCDCALESLDPLLLHIASERGYLPSNDERKALFLFLSGQMDAYRDIDPLEGHPLLIRGVLSATPKVRSQVLEMARANGLVSIILSLGKEGNDIEWSSCDWKTRLRILAQETEHQEMFRLLFHAPLPFAVDIVHSLAASGWKPRPEDTILWRELLSNVPDVWDYPAPPSFMGKTLAGSGGLIQHAAVSPDGLFLATASYDGTLCQWSLPDGNLVGAGIPGGNGITTLSFSSDGNALLIGSKDGTIRLFHPGENVSFMTLDGHHAPVTGTVFSDVGNMLISGGEDGRLCSWTWPGCSDFSSTHAHEGPVTSLAAHEGMRASSGIDGAIRIWKMNGEDVRLVPGPGKAMRHLFFSAHGDALVGVDSKGTIRIWNCLDGTLSRVISSSGAHLIAWAHNPEGTFGVLADGDSEVVVFAFPEGSEYARFDVPGQGISCLTLNPDGTHLFAGCRDGYLHTWSIRDRRKISMVKGHPEWIRLLCVNKEGTCLMSAGREGTVRIRSIPELDLLCTIHGPGTGIHCLSSTPGGNLLACGTDGGIIRVWNSQSGTLAGCHNLFTGRIECIAVNPSGTTVACGDAQGRISLWELQSGSLLATLVGHRGGILALAIDMGGSLLASAGWDGMVRIWSLPRGDLVAALSGHSSPVTSLTFLPNTPFLASGSQDRTAVIWDLASQKIHTRITGHSHVVSCLGASGDGKILATGSWDRTVRLWSVPCGEPRGVLRGHLERVKSLAVHPDGSLLASATESGAVALFSLPECAPIRTGNMRADARNGLCLIAAGNLLASAGRDGTLRLSGMPWTRPLSRANPRDIEYVQSCITPDLSPSSGRQWRFLERLLAGKFRHCVEFGGTGLPAGPYDFEIVERDEGIPNDIPRGAC